MNCYKLKFKTIALLLIVFGGYEFACYLFFTPSPSLGTGSFIITLMTIILTSLFTTWIFHIIHRQNEQLDVEQSSLAVYKERERLTKELHDGIAQSLFSLNVKLKQGKVEDAQYAVFAIDNDLRQAIFLLRPLLDENVSLTRRIEQWLNLWSTRTGIDVDLELSNQLDHLFSLSQEVQLFAIIQEAFNNIRKHSHAQNTLIRVRILNDFGWQMEISDNGQGIENSNLRTVKHGLKMMADRAEKLGAIFEVRKRNEGGTELLLTSFTVKTR